MKKLDAHLKRRTFFVGDQMTIVDILLCCQLNHAIKCVIKESVRRKIPHFQRWFTHIRSIRPFVEEMGEVVLCSEEAIVLKFPEPEQEEKKV